MKTLVGKAKIHIAGETELTEVNIYVNENDNLVFEGIGSVLYELLEEELTLTRV